MNDRWVLVDGYSVLHAWPALRKLAGRSLGQRRDALVRVLWRYADQTGFRLTVVFDGYAAKHPAEASAPTPGIEVVFSEPGKTADDVIERLVGQAGDRRRILVVSSDGLERQTVESMGAASASAELFLAEVEAALHDLAGSVRAHGRARRVGALRDRFGSFR